jgi:hypothetical protein
MTAFCFEISEDYYFEMPVVISKRREVNVGKPV